MAFRYPEETPLGYTVEKIEAGSMEFLRVHLVSRPRGELYVEVSKYPVLSARSLFQRHRVELEGRFEGLLIKKLKKIEWNSVPAYEYRFEWSGGARSVLLFERDDATYRILFDPHGSLNNEILSTLEFMA